MTKITIVFDDGAMYIDKVGYTGLDMSFAPSGYHALQWNGVSGWIEFLQDENGIQASNQCIDILPEWVAGIETSWQSADNLMKEKQLEIQAGIDAADAVSIQIEANIAAENQVTLPVDQQV